MKALVFAEPRRIAELAPGRRHRLSGGQALTLVPLGQQLQMQLHFVVEVSIVGAAAEKPRQAGEARANPAGHLRPVSSIRSTRAMTPEIWFHCSVSLASCFLPARVMA